MFGIIKGHDPQNPTLLSYIIGMAKITNRVVYFRHLGYFRICEFLILKCKNNKLIMMKYFI